MYLIDKKINNSKGFSLVEVMVVVGIIALLAAIVTPNLLNARVTSNETAAKAALKSISVALENYAAINSEYPATTTDLVSVTPPYLNVDYFTGVHNGYQFTDTLTLATYQIVAAPTSTNHGTKSFSVTTGGVLTEL